MNRHKFNSDFMRPSIRHSLALGRRYINRVYEGQYICPIFTVTKIRDEYIELYAEWEHGGNMRSTMTYKEFERDCYPYQYE